MLHFAWPWMLLLLPLPWLVSRLLPPARPPGPAVFLPFAAQLGAGQATVPPARTGLLSLAWMLVWALLLAAAMRPQWLGEPQPVPTSGRRVLLAVDISRSMAADDMAGGYSRLQVVQAVAGEFIAGRHGDQVGLILFATRPYLQAPLTADLETARRFLHEAMIGMAGTSTAIGDAIGLAIKRLRDNPAPGGGDGGGETVLILLTDGSSNAGVMAPLKAAELAAQEGLKIYTIGVGAASGGGLFGLGRGNADLDEQTLVRIAEITGGAYFRATDADTLHKVYARIEELEPSAGQDQWYRPRSEWFVWPLGLALLLSLPLAAWRRA